MDENIEVMNEVPEEVESEECESSNGGSVIGLCLGAVGIGALIGLGVKIGEKAPELVGKAKDKIHDKVEAKREKRAARKADRARKHDEDADPEE